MCGPIPAVLSWVWRLPGICSVRELAELTVKIDYPHLAKIQNMASEQLDLDEADQVGEENFSNFRIANIQYTDKIGMKIQTLPGGLKNVKMLFQNITSGKSEILSQEIVREKSLMMTSETVANQRVLRMKKSFVKST